MKRFQECHPVTNFVFYISAVVFGMIFRHPVFLCVSFLSVFLYNVMLSGKKAVKSFFCFLLPLVFAAALINGLTTHYGVTRLFTLPNGNGICLEPIIYGLVTGASAAVVIMIFSCYNKTVDSDKLYYLLSKKFPKMALILTMSLRFVPLYSKKLGEISEAQKGLGIGTDSGKPIERIKNGGRIISVLISLALESSVETADSMKSRGYGLKNRSHYDDYRFSRTDIFITSIVLLCDLIVIIGAIAGESFVLYNPFFKIPEITLFSVFIYFSYAVLFTIPMLNDSLENIRWKRLQLKI